SQNRKGRDSATKTQRRTQKPRSRWKVENQPPRIFVSLCSCSCLCGLAPCYGDRVYVSAYLHRSRADLEGSLMRRLVGRNMIKWVLLVVLASAATFYISCANGGFGFRREDPLLFSGTIETREIRVGSKLGGRVTEVLALEGQETQAGQTIVRFDVAGVEAQRLQAEAKIGQQQARLERLERGARPEEKAQASAATETARANLEAVRNWPRPEEIEQARASLAAAEADLNNADVSFQRARKLYSTDDASRQELDEAKFRLDNARAKRDAEKKRLDLLLNGSRKEDIRAAEERFRQAQEAERLVIAGPRAEEIADARAQLAEAKAKLEEIKVQIAEGEVKSPANSIVEVL